jgi:iron(III) transport system substrate-binding protein
MFILGLTALFSVLLITGCTRARTPAPSAATADTAVTGRIMIYTSMYEDVIEAVGRVLDRQFPNARIEFFYGGTGAIQAKIAAEVTSGRLGCDMLMVAEPSYALELKERGMLHPYLSPERANLAFPYDNEGYWYPVRISNMVLAFNPERYPKNTIPNSLRDFAFDPDVTGAISMSNPLTSGTAMASVVALRDKYGYEYFQALGDRRVMIESGSVALTKLETGECKVIMVLEESVLKKREEEGSKLEVIYPTDGTIVVPSTIMTINDQWSANQNTNAAHAITNFFLGPEGQAAIVAAWMHSPRNNPRPPYDAIPTEQIRANSMPVDWEAVFRQREEVRTRFEEHVSRRR